MTSALAVGGGATGVAGAAAAPVNAEATFCNTCGIKPFYVPRSNPDGYSVNVRCLDSASIALLTVRPFDDSDREASEARIRHLSQG